MKLKLLALLGALAVGTPSTLNADPISFDFTGGWWPRVANEMSFTESGVTARVTGHRERNGVLSQKFVVQGRPGLGVYSGGWDNPAVDGDRDSNERLRFEFDPAPVALESVTFSLTCDWHGGPDNFGLAIDGNVVLSNAVAPRGAGVFDVSFALSGVGSEGTVFEFFTVDRSDDWAMAGMTVSLVDSVGLKGGGVAVPEPSSLLLLGLGAASVGLLRRRRREKKPQPTA